MRCAYCALHRLEDIDVNVLKRIIRKSVSDMKKPYTWKP
jgi:hypothetical protein